MSLVWLLLLRAVHRTGLWWRTYSRYLDSATWRRRADAYMDSVGRRCEDCGRRAAHVHHLSYALVGWEPRRHLRALCRRCHSLAHRRFV